MKSNLDLFNNKRILVTGACGTIGREIVRSLLQTEIAELCAIDTNESEIFFLDQKYRKDERLHCDVGDVRDYNKLYSRMSDIDIVFHGAALKHVILCERSPFDAVQTNILGVNNVINAALANDVDRVIFMSSDKAVNPTNVMGTSKLMGERLFTAANSLRKNGKTIFASTRFGNVLGSTGSVLQIFYHQIRAGIPVTLTHPGMSRFVMTAEQAADLVLKSALIAHGGEVLVTKMPVVKISDLLMAMIELVAPKCGYHPGNIEVKTIGIKAGEKLYEELLSDEESQRIVELPELFVILPAFRSVYGSLDYKYTDQLETAEIRPYRSDRVPPMTLDEIKTYLNRHGVVESIMNNGTKELL